MSKDRLIHFSIKIINQLTDAPAILDIDFKVLEVRTRKLYSIYHIPFLKLTILVSFRPYTKHLT